MKKNNFILWFAFNILLPLTPVFIKLSITIFGNSQKIIVTVLDSSELLYFNFIICVIFLYEMIRKENKSGLDYWMELGAFLIIILDIVLLMLIYGNQDATNRIKICSLIISILVPIVVSVRKYKEYYRS